MEMKRVIRRILAVLFMEDVGAKEAVVVAVVETFMAILVLP